MKPCVSGHLRLSVYHGKPHLRVPKSPAMTLRVESPSRFPYTHSNASLFKDPDTFYPKRWLDKKEGPILRQYVMPFSQGPRACIGRNLAYLEQQILIATLI